MQISTVIIIAGLALIVLGYAGYPLAVFQAETFNSDVYFVGPGSNNVAQPGGNITTTQGGHFYVVVYTFSWPGITQPTSTFNITSVQVRYCTGQVVKQFGQGCLQHPGTITLPSTQVSCPAEILKVQPKAVLCYQFDMQMNPGQLYWVGALMNVTQNGNPFSVFPMESFQITSTAPSPSPSPPPPIPVLPRTPFNSSTSQTPIAIGGVNLNTTMLIGAFLIFVGFFARSKEVHSKG